MELQYPYLFSPLRVRGVMLKNRIFTGPAGVPRAEVISSTDYGSISMYDRSRGGAAVNVTTTYSINSFGDTAFEKYGKDKTREILSVMRQAGSLACAQVGPRGETTFNGKSAVPIKGQQKMTEGTEVLTGVHDGISFNGRMYRAATREELHNCIENTAQTALAAKEFGFDMLFLAIGHDGLASIFLSRFNTRTDEYGGSLENRCRFAVELARRVRELVGPDFPIITRIGRTMGPVPESYTEDEALYLIKALSPYIDMFNVSNGMDTYGGTIDRYEANVHANSTVFEPRYYNVDFAARVKRECDTIVVLNGGVGPDPQIADDLIRDGKIDAVMAVRQSFADPQWPNKALAGHKEDIVPCIRCLYCYHISTVHDNVQCSVNPRYRRENRVPEHLTKTASPKKVVIVGGGPAGMKAALTAEEKGHHVILLERADRLGGQLNVAEHGRYKQDLKAYRDYLLCQMGKRPGIEVRLGTDATPEMVRALEPDALILALGAKTVELPLPGWELGKPVVQAYLDGDAPTGQVAVVGGGAIGAEYALELAENGTDVTLIEMGDTLSARENWLYRIAQRQHMRKCPNLHILLNTACTAITPQGVQVRDADGERLIKADTVYTAAGMKADKEAVFAFYGITPRTFEIGDCHRAGHVLDATNDGYFVAANLE